MAVTRRLALQPERVLIGKFGYAETGTTAEIVEVPAGAWIPPYGVTLYISTACSGGTPSIDIGDGSNDDGWIDTTEVTEGTTGCYTGGSASPYALTGKYYSTADTIDAVVSGSMSAGACTLIVRYHLIGDQV